MLGVVRGCQGDGSADTLVVGCQGDGSAECQGDGSADNLVVGEGCQRNRPPDTAATLTAPDT